ncbi:GAF domain-containing protein [Streptomyces sp. NPDC001904]|uniref:GAF domain-containing protein n=1 Tax=Streptomyces sp. NPDC001904 TaxID=3154531 RepID=UPI003320AF31
MFGDTGDTGARGVPPPDDVLAGLLARAHRAVRAGDGPARALPPDTVGLFGLDALTLSALTRDGRPELLWADPPRGLGVELDALQYAIGDGPVWQAAHEGRTVNEADLDTVDTARWPLFLPVVVDARARARAVVALPLNIGSATIGVLTGYRVTPGPLTPDRLASLHHLARILLLALVTQLAVPADGTTAEGGLRVHHAEVHQATGYLASALDIPLSQALLRLRAHAAGDGPITELARAFLTHRLSPDTLQR